MVPPRRTLSIAVWSAANRSTPTSPATFPATESGSGPGRSGAASPPGRRASGHGTGRRVVPAWAPPPGLPRGSWRRWWTPTSATRPSEPAVVPGLCSRAVVPGLNESTHCDARIGALAVPGGRRRTAVACTPPTRTVGAERELPAAGDRLGAGKRCERAEGGETSSTALTESSGLPVTPASSRHTLHPSQHFVACS